MTNVRPAELQDLQACVSIDHSCVTEHVWQMDVESGNNLVAVRFRAVRLPRSVYVKYPRDHSALLSEWHHRDCFLVATRNGGTAAAGESIVGYLTMSDQAWHKTGWVADLVVAPEHRRKGIGTQLLHAGKTWARETGLRRLVVETQTKSYPAICFLERQSFSFCGYSDRYYANQDIALFFALDLR